MYGPEGEAQVFERKEDIPEGWIDHPVILKEGENEAVAQPDEGTAQISESAIGDATSPVEPSEEPKKKRVRVAKKK